VNGILTFFVGGAHLFQHPIYPSLTRISSLISPSISVSSPILQLGDVEIHIVISRYVIPYAIFFGLSADAEVWAGVDRFVLEFAKNCVLIYSLPKFNGVKICTFVTL
jgi:hypothetical protein